jgi:hypothetical protein
MIESLDWYTGKRVRSSQPTEVTVKHFLIAAILDARARGITLEDVKMILEQVNEYEPEPRRSVEQNLKDLYG